MLRIAESCRNCQAREPRIYSSGFDEQREKSKEEKMVSVRQSVACIGQIEVRQRA